MLQFFGDYVGTVKTPGLRWANPLLHEEAHLAARAQLRERQAEGQRPRRQPDRDRGGRRLARRRHRRGRLRGRRLPELRQGADRGRRAQPGDELPVRRPRGRPDVAARQHGRGRGAPEEGDPGAARRRRASRCSRRASATWRTRRRSPQAMLQRQQARRDHRGASADRRRRGRHGRDGARACCRSASIVELDNERKAAMVSNLLVVLCGERSTQPIINTGTIYQ